MTKQTQDTIKEVLKELGWPEKVIDNYFETGEIIKQNINPSESL